MGFKIYVKRFAVSFLVLLLINTGRSWAQCNNTTPFGTATAPTTNTPLQISGCTFGGEYNTINGAVAGQTYQFTSTGGSGNFLTVRQGTPGGTVLAFGNSPISATVTVSGPIFLHVNTNASCGTDGSCHTTTITCTSCPGPPDPCTGPFPTVTCGVPQVSTHSGPGAWSVTACGFSTPGQERIYNFIPNSTGPHVLQVTAATGGFVDYYYKPLSAGCGPTGWICIDDNSGVGTDPIGTLTEGVPYLILLDPEGTGSFSHTFQINCPPFDPCVNPIPTIACGIGATFTSTGTGAWNTSFCGFTVPGKERLFTFTPNTTGMHTLNVTATNSEWVDYAFKPVSGGCSSAGWTCIDDVLTPGTTSFGPLTAGVQYYILADAETTSTATQTFQIDCPPYDPCVIIPTLTCATPTTASYGGTGASGTINANCGFFTFGVERIYQFTPNVTGLHRIQVTAAPTTNYVDYFFKPVSGGCVNSGWTCIDDMNATGTSATFSLTAGTAYYILADAENTNIFTQSFQVNEPQVPTITCPPNITTSNTAGACSASVVTPNPTTGDNCGVTRLSWVLTGATTGSSPVTGINNVGTRTFNVGTTTVTYTVGDGSGNTATCQFTVTVNDTQPPSLTCPANITQNAAAGLCTANVASPAPTNTDNCAVTRRTWAITGATTLNSPATGINNVGTQTLNVGVNTVTISSFDAAGNSATCSYTITVVDNQNPVITCPPNVTLTTPVGSCTATHNYVVTATDNCAVASITRQSGLASGSAFPLGVNSVTWRATDVNGNFSECTFTVTVLDGQLPVISAHPANRTNCVGTNATFSVTSSNALSYQWETFTGGAWTAIAGATSSTYTVNNVTTAMNTNSFRVRVIGLCTTVTSNIATLFVNTNPIITINASIPPALLPGQFVTLTAVGIPPGGTFVWLKNGSVIAGATTNQLVDLSVDDAGDYSVRYTDLNGCVTTSSVLTVSAVPSNKMWVYPNPNFGTFNIRFFNTVNEKATVNVFNSAGVRVYSRQFNTTLPFTEMTIDLGATAADGTYQVVLVNQAGTIIGSNLVLVRKN